MQGNFAGGNRNHSALQTLFPGDFFLTAQNMLHCYGNMDIQLFPLRGQGNSMPLPDKQRTSQLLFQFLHHTGDIGLIVHQRLCGCREAFQLCHIIKDPVIVITDVHTFLHIIFIYLYFKICIFHISLIGL